MINFVSRLVYWTLVLAIAVLLLLIAGYGVLAGLFASLALLIAPFLLF